MNGISAKYFSTKFITENKLTLSDVMVLEYIYSWVLSKNPPECEYEMGRKCFYLSQTHIANDFEGLITQQGVSQKMKRLKKFGIIEDVMVDMKGRCFVRFCWLKVYESLAPRQYVEQQKYKYCSSWYEQIFKYVEEEEKLEQQWAEEWEKKTLHERIEYYKNEEERFKEEYEQYKQAQSSYNNSGAGMSGLLDESDMNKKVHYCKQADAIAKRILKKYSQYFSNRIPNENQEPSKTYVRLCRKIEDIYNGRFTSSRFYAFDEKVFKNKQFNTDGWREKINGVKGDWGKVKKLVFTAVNNFVLMYDENRMPLKKDYLVTSLNDWFYSDNPNSKGQSQFIQSLNEPMIAKEKLGLDAAVSIASDMKKKSPATYSSCHELNMLLPQNASEITAWKFMRKIIAWGKLFWQFESNAKYFMQCEIDGNLEAGPKVLPALFARYLKDNNINVTLGTLDIEKAADSNAPWVWFIKDACNKHDMNSDYVYCFNDQDFYDAYKNENSGKITFDDMNEIVF